MYPILIDFNGLKLFSLSIFLLIAWFTFSFLFWKSLRDDGVDEEKVFDLTFVITLFSFFGARIFYVLLHWNLFSSAYLKILALWVQPGLTLVSGLIVGILASIYTCKKLKIKNYYFLDALANSLPLTFVIGLIGSLLDGASVGKITNLPIGVSFVGHEGLRHPVQIYQIILFILLYFLIRFRGYKGVRRIWSYGYPGIIFLILTGFSMFISEFFTDGSKYWYNLLVTQWLWIALAAECLGIYIVRVKLFNLIKQKLQKFFVKKGEQ